MSDKGVKNNTPIGELHFVQISGEGKLNYNEDGYEYVATIHLEGKDAEAERTKCDEELGTVAKGQKLGSKGYKNLVRDSEGTLRTPNADGEVIVDDEDISDDCEETDVWAFTYKTNVEFPNGNTKKIDVYNSGSKTGKPQKISLGDKLIGNGTKGAISGKLKRYVNGKNVGVSLFLHAIQIVEFVEYEGGAGFDTQEGDFEGVSDEETGFTGQPDEDNSDSESEEKASTKKKPKAKPKL